MTLGPKWVQVSKRSDFPRGLLAPIGTCFDTFQQCVLSIFLDPSWESPWTTFGAQGLPIGDHSGTIVDVFWDMGGKVKTVLSFERELNFQSLEGSLLGQVESQTCSNVVPGDSLVQFLMNFGVRESSHRIRI